MRCSTTCSFHHWGSSKGFTGLLCLIIIAIAVPIHAETQQETDSFGFPHGMTREFDSTGQLRSEKFYEHGVLNGISKLYYPSGELMTEWVYKNGLRDGPTIGYFRNGNIKDRGFYKKDMLEGTVLLYYPDGTVKARMNFKHNVQDGVSETFDRKGRLEKRFNYSKGRLLREEDFDDSGKRIRVLEFPNLHATP